MTTLLSLVRVHIPTFIRHHALIKILGSAYMVKQNLLLGRYQKILLIHLDKFLVLYGSAVHVGQQMVVHPH